MNVLKPIHLRTSGFKTLSVFAFALLANGALAQIPPAYRLAAIDNEANGHTVVAGDYDKAITRLRTKADSRAPRFSEHNNLCVALVASGRLDAATESCEQAVQAGHKLVRRNRHAPLHIRRDYAIALSNRGVLRVLDGDVAGARNDFEAAIEQRSRLAEPSDNLARLEAVTEQRAAAT